MKIGELRSLLSEHQLRLHKDLGQNFLVDEPRADELARLAGTEAGDTVIEIGTGLGALTRSLAQIADRVVSIEIDSGLVRVLRSEALLPGNVELIHADAMAVDLLKLLQDAEGPVRVVANLPYSVATPILRRLLGLREHLVDWSVMVQREVGARMTAITGERNYGSFAVIHAMTVTALNVMEIGSGCFYPAPRVRSSFLRIEPLSEPLLQEGELEDLERVVRAAFNQRRKMIGNSLRSAGFGPPAQLEALLRDAGISASDRPQEVDPARWFTLARAMAQAGMLVVPSVTSPLR